MRAGAAFIRVAATVANPLFFARARFLEAAPLTRGHDCDHGEVGAVVGVAGTGETGVLVFTSFTAIVIVPYYSSRGLAFQRTNIKRRDMIAIHSWMGE